MINTTLITGAGRGIGYEIAKKFATDNDKLVLIFHKKNQVKNVTEFFKKIKIKFIYYVGDLTDPKFIKKITKEIDYVNNLINNAAITNKDMFLDVDEKKLNKIININLKVPFVLSQIFSKKMIKKKIKGCIINLSSQLGHIGAYNRSAYCMTKFAIEGLTKALALDLGKYGIRVNCVAPTKVIVDPKEIYKNKKNLKIIRNKTALKKFATAKQIASIVHFLTTKASESITGASVLSDAGWVAGK